MEKIELKNKRENFESAVLEMEKLIAEIIAVKNEEIMRARRKAKADIKIATEIFSNDEKVDEKNESIRTKRTEELQTSYDKSYRRASRAFYKLYAEDLSNFRRKSKNGDEAISKEIKNEIEESIKQLLHLDPKTKIVINTNETGNALFDNGIKFDVQIEKTATSEVLNQPPDSAEELDISPPAEENFCTSNTDIFSLPICEFTSTTATSYQFKGPCQLTLKDEFTTANLCTSSTKLAITKEEYMKAGNTNKIKINLSEGLLMVSNYKTPYLWHIKVDGRDNYLEISPGDTSMVEITKLREEAVVASIHSDTEAYRKDNVTSEVNNQISTKIPEGKTVSFSLVTPRISVDDASCQIKTLISTNGTTTTIIIITVTLLRATRKKKSKN